MIDVVLVGTCHTYQLPDNSAASEFDKLLRELCVAGGVKAIAEEMNTEALAESNAHHSTGELVARALDILHRYCDPNRDQRQALGIMQENPIKATAHIRGWDRRRIRQEILASHLAREQYWLQQIRELDRWPLLFVCGANHVGSFKKLLSTNDIRVRVGRRDWAPASR